MSATAKLDYIESGLTVYVGFYSEDGTQVWNNAGSAWVTISGITDTVLLSYFIAATELESASGGRGVYVATASNLSASTLVNVLFYSSPTAATILESMIGEQYDPNDATIAAIRDDMALDSTVAKEATINTQYSAIQDDLGTLAGNTGTMVNQMTDVLNATLTIGESVILIDAKTTNLPASPAAVGSAMTLTSAYDAAKTAASQTSVDDIPTAEQNADAIASHNIDGISFTKIMTALLSTAAGKVLLTDNGDGTYTAVFKGQDGITTVLSVTYNPATGTRTTTATIP